MSIGIKGGMMNNSTRSRSLLLVGLLLVLALMACRARPASESSATQAASSTTLTDLESIEQLQTAFNADEGKPRLLLILAPT